MASHTIQMQHEDLESGIVILRQLLEQGAQRRMLVVGITDGCTASAESLSPQAVTH